MRQSSRRWQCNTFQADSTPAKEAWAWQRLHGGTEDGLKDVADAPLETAASCGGPLTPSHGPFFHRHGGNTWHAVRPRLGLTYPRVWHCRGALWCGQGGLPLSLRIGRRSLPCMEEVLHQNLRMNLCCGSARYMSACMPTWRMFMSKIAGKTEPRLSSSSSRAWTQC